MPTVQSTMSWVEVTPVCDTSPYAVGDTLFDVTAVVGFTWDIDCPTLLKQVVVLDEDDNTAAPMTLYFFYGSGTFGTANAAPSISDANARNIIGFVDIDPMDWRDVTGSKVACINNIDLVVKPIAVGTSFYVAATTGGTPTQTASGIKLRFGFQT